MGHRELAWGALVDVGRELADGATGLRGRTWLRNVASALGRQVAAAVSLGRVIALEVGRLALSLRVLGQLVLGDGLQLALLIQSKLRDRLLK